MSALIFVDVEAGPAPGVPGLPDLHDFGAVEYVRSDDPRRGGEGRGVTLENLGGFGRQPGPVGRTFRGVTVPEKHPEVAEVFGDLANVRVGTHAYAFQEFAAWLVDVGAGGQVSFVSDNVAFDWQWVNHYFWKHVGRNPFGHSGRRISDFYAGLCGDFRRTQEWKRLRVTKHDHNPVHDAIGNAEAFDRILRGER